MYTIPIGPISLPIDRLLLIVSLAVALIVSAVVGRKSKIKADGSIASIFIVSMIMARISFVIRYFEQYQGDWLGIIDIRDGGFDVITGFIVAIAMLSWLLWKRPKIRKALLSGAISGLLVWGIISFSLSVIKGTSQYLPDIMVVNSDSKPVALGSVENHKPRVINLWATWCPPCRREMPVLQQAQQNYPEIGFIFVNQGEHHQVVKEYLDRESLKIENMLTDSKGQLGSLIGSRALPTTIFVDEGGVLVDAHLGELSRATLKQKLERLESSSRNKEVED